MKKLTILGSIHPDAMALAEARPDVEVTVAPGIHLPPDEILAVAEGAHAIGVRNAILRKDLLQQLPDLEIISRHGVGCDSIDVDWMSAHGKPVAIAVGGNDSSVAEHTLAMMLTLARDLANQHEGVAAADWAVRQRVRPFDIRGKTLLIVGFGRIGSRVAPLAKAFGMEVIAHDPYVTVTADGVEQVATLSEGLARADVVTVHTPLNAETRGLIGAQALATMPPGALLINNARGGICDETSVAEALISGHLAGHGVDVFDGEPVDPANPLLTAPNTLMTPHSASMTPQGMRAMATIMIQNILDHFDGRLSPTMVFNRKELGL
ncbi:MAG: hydroxyacid dehydrogenase [Pseudomonadota bacterium]